MVATGPRSQPAGAAGDGHGRQTGHRVPTHPDIRKDPMDINALFTDAGLRAFTDAQRDQHLTDATQYAQLSDIVRRRLEQTPIDGDRAVGNWSISARHRARKVSRKLKRMERASRRAASSSEALYAAYVNHVLELPDRRERAALRKAERKGRQLQSGAGDRVAKSLHKSAGVFGGQLPGASQQTQTGPQFLPSQSFPYPVAAGGETQQQSIADFIPKAPKEGR
ncbi:hypothetical protein [Actinacidiphila paucisporea]|nr:hypothetical protein [Actinacidiphila paucisporea]